MPSVLKNILRFTGLAIGVPSIQPHLVNINGFAKIPRVLAANADGFTITGDDTNVTVTRGAAAAAAVDVYVEYWHSFEDAQPMPSGIATSMFPFVIQGGGSAGGSAVGGIVSMSGGTTFATGPGISFSNGSGITFGISGNTITASVIGGSGTGVGASAGTQSQGTGVVVFSNSNNISFGMTNSSIITASASFPAETPFAISGGTQSQSTGTMSFANSNGVTFGLNAGTMTVSVAGTAPETPFGISAGTQSGSTGTIVFANSNGITFGMSGSSQVTASFSTVVFSNLNGVSFGLAGSTLTASVAAGAGGASATFMEFNAPHQDGGVSGNAQLLTVDRILVPAQIAASRFDVIFSCQTAEAGSTASVSLQVGIYTMAGSTASLASSHSALITYVSSNESNFTGQRWRTLAGGGTWNVTPGDYLLGYIARASTTFNPAFMGQSRFFPAVAQGTYTQPFGQGLFTSAGDWAALPASIHMSAIMQTGLSSFAGNPSAVIPTGRLVGSV